MSSTELDLPEEALLKLLRNNDINIKKQCFQYIKLMTGDACKCKDLHGNSALLSQVLEATQHGDELSKLALESLINVASVQDGANAIFGTEVKDEVSKYTLVIFKLTVDRTYKLAEHASNVLTNMTVWEDVALKVANSLTNDCNELHMLFEGVHNKHFNPFCPNLSQHLCQLFGNLAQSLNFQKYLLTAESGNLFCSVLSIINNGETVIQRRGIVSTLYNCLFNSENHSLLLKPPFAILSYLLYPLAGPEEFDDDEVDKLPIELQYLGCEKERESDSYVRKLLLHSLLMLCDTKHGRTILRDQQTYLILREYHKWETEPSLILACENVVDILIRTEDEIGVDNLKCLEVPEELQEQFRKMDTDIINDSTT